MILDLVLDPLSIYDLMMIEIDKGPVGLGITSTTPPSLNCSSINDIAMQEKFLSLPDKRSETAFPSVSLITHEDEQIPGENPEENPTRREKFHMVLFEEALRVAMVCYLSIGVVSAVVYFGRQVIFKVDLANKTWKAVGLVKSILAILVILVVLWYKGLLHKGDFLEKNDVENSMFFYTFIAIASAFSWIYYLILEFRNFQFRESCAVLPDLVIPLTQMLFVITSMMTISDVIFFKMKVPISKVFYMVYKSSAMLVLINCINCMIFDLTNNEARHLQDLLSNGSRNIFCYNNNDTSNFILLLTKIGPTLEVFSVIFFLSAIGLLIKPLRQFWNVRFLEEEDRQALLPPGFAPEALPRQGREDTTLAIVIGSIMCLLSCCGILLDALSNSNSDNKELFQMLFICLPLGVYVVTGILSIYLLKLMHKHFRTIGPEKESMVDTFILGLSTFGQVVSCLKMIINSSQFLNGDNPPDCTSDLCINTHKVCIVFYLMAIVQSLVQAMALDYINRVNYKVGITRETFYVLMNPMLVLTLSNIGLLIINIFLLTSYSTLGSFNSEFNHIVWDFLSTISDPLTVCFRGYCVLFLLRTLSKLNHIDNIQ